MTTLSLHTDVTASADSDEDAEVIILGPSLGSSTHLWDLALPTLNAHHKVIRFDLPGHGKSPSAPDEFSMSDLAQAVVAIADEYGVDTFDYAGVSISGALALEIAHLYPSRIKHAAVVCSAPYFGGPEGWSERISQVSSSGTASVVPAIPERWFAPDFPAKDPGTVQKLLADIVATNDADYIKVCHALAGFDSRDYLASIQVPVLVISGELDPGTPPAAGAVIADNVSGARQVIISHTSHQAVVEKPLEVAKELVTFFSEA